MIYYVDDKLRIVKKYYKKGEEMENSFLTRTELLIGKEGIEKLKKAKVLVVGIGGVGSFVVEALARAGVMQLQLMDHDKIDVTNINRQIHALTSTVGESKVEAMKERVLQINPEIEVETVDKFFDKENADFLIDSSLSYIVDAIDTISSKIELIYKAKEKNISIISCMGTGNKLDPTKFKVTDIYKTKMCPLAKVMRKKLKEREIKNLKVLYSEEEPIKNEIPGSISFVPSVAGLIIAGEVIKDILNKN